MMGRAQDQALLAKDREQARADVDRLQAEHESNQIGLSKAPAPPPRTAAVDTAAPPPPTEPPAPTEPTPE